MKDLLAGTEFAQVAGVLTQFEVIGQRAGKRLVAELKDKTGVIELTWFQGSARVIRAINCSRIEWVPGTEQNNRVC